MDKFEKLIRRLPNPLRRRVKRAMYRILAGKVENLDVKPVKGVRGMYRCRIRDVRIVYHRSSSGVHTLIEANFRSSAYKKLK